MMTMKQQPTESLSRNTEAVADSLVAMIKRELATISRNDGGYLNPSDFNMITADDRTKLVDCCYDFVDHCQYSRETVASAMEMVDRFLSVSVSVSMPAGNSNSAAADVARVSDEALTDQSKFQLLTITALYVAIKINERTAISSELFAKMCLGAYTVEEIEDMERILLSGLSWRCHAPTAHQIGLSILSMILPYVSEIPEETWGFLIDEMKYLTELAVRDYYFSTQRTSTIALAAILNVINDMNMSTNGHQGLLGAFLSVIMECFDFDHPKQIFAVRIRLQSLLDKQEPPESVPREEEDVDVISLGDSMLDESSLDDSVKTPKVSNRSSREELDHEEEVALSSPSSSLHNLASEMQDLQL